MNFRSTLIKTLPIHCYDQRSRSPTFKLKKTCNLAKSPRLTLTTQKMVDAKQAWFLCEATFPACLVYFKSKMADCKRLSGQEKIVYFWLWFWGIPDVIAFITIRCFKLIWSLAFWKPNSFRPTFRNFHFLFVDSLDFPTVRHLESFVFFREIWSPVLFEQFPHFQMHCYFS